MKLVIPSISLLAFACLPLSADYIPYGNPGNIAPTQTFTAMATGNIIGYFYGADAADVDSIRMCDTTTSTCSAYAFQNNMTAVGASFDFGPVNAGDNLEFELHNANTGMVLSSIPADSSDGINHAYGTAYSGGFHSIPAGTYIGMEDLTPGEGSDLDYNDDQFVFTNVGVPEPSSIVLFGTLLLGAAVAIRRRLKS